MFGDYFWACLTFKCIGFPYFDFLITYINILYEYMETYFFQILKAMFESVKKKKAISECVYYLVLKVIFGDG